MKDQAVEAQALADIASRMDSLGQYIVDRSVPEVREILEEIYLDRPKYSDTGIIPVCPYVQHEGTLRPNGVWTTRSLPRCSLELAARLFDSISGKIIVEIGSGLQGPHAGESVKVWSTQTNAKAIYCLDLDRQCIEDVFRWAQSEGHSQVHPRVVDGLAFVGEFPGEIDLLYLDFWTEDPAGAPFGTGREEGYLSAFRVAEPKLAARSMILIDDTEKLGPWKHTKIVPAARQAGFEVLWTGRQTMLAKGILEL